MSPKNNLQRKSFRLSVVLAVCAAVVAVAYPGLYPQRIIAQEGARNVNEAGDMECISYCSPTRPGTVMMEVKMRLADHLVTETDLRSRVRQQGLEATVYADGFERGLFAVVPAIQPRMRFRAQTRAGVSRVQSQNRIPGLEKLVITDVATRLDRAAQPLVLTQPPLTRVASEAESVTVRLEGLDPGMEYTFRAPGGRSVVTCRAVVCPVDRIPAATNRARRKP